MYRTSLFFIIIVYNRLIKTVLLNNYEKEIGICIDDLKHCYFLKFAGIIVNYKEKTLTTGITVNIKYSICYLLPKQYENLKKT